MKSQNWTIKWKPYPYPGLFPNSGENEVSVKQNSRTGNLFSSNIYFDNWFLNTKDTSGTKPAVQDEGAAWNMSHVYYRKLSFIFHYQVRTFLDYHPLTSNLKYKVFIVFEYF